MITNWKTEQHCLKVAVTNYENVWRMENTLIKWKPQMIVLDESHRIKTHTSKQSKELHKLGKLAHYRMILTGTPVSNSPLEFFSQYKFLDPGIFGANYHRFLHRYAIMGGYGGYQIVQYMNLDELTEKAHSIAYRVRKEEAVDLPETVNQTIYCEMEPAAKKAYTKLEKEFVAEVKNEDTISAPNVLTRLLRLSQIVGGFVTTDEGQMINISRSKIKALAEKVDDLIDAGKKVVIFARFRAELDAITEMLNTEKIDHVRIDGSVKDRGVLVDRFQHDSDCKVFIGQLKAVREGLTLTAADTAIFYSYDYSYADYDQAKARIHRIGQINKCTYIHLVMDNTVDTDIFSALHNKRNMADVVLNRWKSLTKTGLLTKN